MNDKPILFGGVRWPVRRRLAEGTNPHPHGGTDRGEVLNNGHRAREAGGEGVVMNRTKIEWAEAVWNPVTGCTPVSEGCRNCYARRMARRLAGRCGYPAVLRPPAGADEPFRVMLHEDRLVEPLRWRKPRRVFVCSMGDLFHEAVPWEAINKVWTVAHVCAHKFLFLTKRPARMLEFFRDQHHSWAAMTGPDVPPSNCWLGVSVEDQASADERIPLLLQTPAAIRFVSVEPMLGPVNIKGYLDGSIRWSIRTNATRLDWVIGGGETGLGARPMHIDWVRSLRDQCAAAHVPFFFKQWGEWQPVHGTGRTTGDEEEEVRPFRWLAVGGTARDSGCPPDALMLRVGRKRAGRELDGRTWDEFPKDKR